MSNEMAWLLHGVFLGMMLAAMIRLIADAVAAQRVAEVGQSAAARALKMARGDVYLSSFRRYQYEQQREAA
ncbi:hypothetical protein [Streptomyces sp. NPDC001741]|uniref:hypothetical protein n=1 Tax=Streptomyces sp. NPDC001741 TaxID=3364605 RepID=UPI0036A22D59